MRSWRTARHEKTGDAMELKRTGRRRAAAELGAIRDCDLVIEAATENLELKQKIFRQMDEIARKEAVIASNTSSISITRLAALTGRPDQVIGMHFFNPVAVLALGEMIPGLQTSDSTHPIGPLALCDLIGLDVELAVMQVLYEGFKDPKYRPAPLLVDMVEAGYLGRKAKRGFFNYAE